MATDFNAQEVALTAMKAVVRQLPLAVAIVDVSGRVLHANARLREFIARHYGDALPEDLLQAPEIFHLDGRRCTVDQLPLMRSISTGEHVVDEEYFHRLPDGSRIHARCSSSPVYDEEDRIMAAVLLISDISESKRLEQHQRHHASLFEIIDDAVVATDVQFRITACNRAARELYGADVLGDDARNLELELIGVPDERGRLSGYLGIDRGMTAQRAMP